MPNPRARDRNPASRFRGTDRANFLIAETGSVALNDSKDDRGKCFLAERLWILVAEREILPSLDAGMERMHDLVTQGARHPLLMTSGREVIQIDVRISPGQRGIVISGPNTGGRWAPFLR